MPPNQPRRRNDPIVDKSLEATRNIEYQLLNMKTEMEKVSKEAQHDIDLAPAVSHTLGVLQQIDEQLQNMRALLENYTNLSKYKEEGSNWSLEPGETPDHSDREPRSPNHPPPYPPTYPKNSESDYYHRYDHEHERYPPEHYQEYYPYPPPYANPYFMPPPYNPYYGYPMHPPQYHYPPNYGPPPQQRPYQQSEPRPPHGYDQPRRHSTPPEDMYYDSAKYPTASSNEPAYSTKTRAIPKQTFKIAYYPWQQIMGQKSPTDSRTPYMNLYDLGGEYLVYVELPGVEKDDLELRVDEQSIWINGKPTILGNEEGNPVIQEHGFHEFFRQVNLPSKINTKNAHCKFENGILQIKLTKNNPKMTMKKIKIQ